MERLTGVDTRLTKIESNLDTFKSEAFRTLATKADVSEAKNSIIMLVVSAILLSQLLLSILKKLGT